MDLKPTKIEISECSDSDSEAESGQEKFVRHSVQEESFKNFNQTSSSRKGSSKSSPTAKVEEVINNFSVLLPNLIEERDEDGALVPSRLVKTPDYPRKAHSSPVHEVRRHSSEDTSDIKRPQSYNPTHVGAIHDLFTYLASIPNLAGIVG